MRNNRIFFIIAIVIYCMMNLNSDEMLSKDILDKIDQAVFEVVVLKPVKDSLIYEKSLPYELIPINIRNDSYYSIGTAFAVGSGRFLTAAHVLALDEKTLNDTLFLRDKNGNVYEIDQIYKYFDHKDFVLFSIKDNPVTPFFEFNFHPVYNEKVYAVGNAFGEGIIIRDGVLTSKTPEDDEGAWDWYRFSAAASPGNSGGPLLDKNGQVIGIISRKSTNENLNYALPVSVVEQFDENIALVYQRIRYGLFVFNQTQLDTYQFSVKLPKHYLDLRKALVDHYTDFIEKNFNQFVIKHHDRLFPNSKGSANILHSSDSWVFPRLIMESEDGNWSLYQPDDINTAELNRNGYIKYGDLGGIYYIYFKKPDNCKLSDLLNDSKYFMDNLLKGLPYNRDFGKETIRVISLGKAGEEDLITDRYQRKWLIRNWLIEYNDAKLVTLSTPVPGGTVTLLSIGSLHEVDSGFFLQMKEYLNYITYSYYGCFNEWNEFFDNPEYLPVALNDIRFAFEAGKKFSFTSSQLNISNKPAIFNLTGDSEMKLVMSFYKEHDRVVWGLSGVLIGEDKAKDNYFMINREAKPEPGMKNDYFSEWDKLIKQEYPYNNNMFIYEQNTYIESVHSKYINLIKQNRMDKDALYTAILSLEGNVNDLVMKKKLKDVISCVTINE